jgi:hypothetical protein
VNWDKSHIGNGMQRKQVEVDTFEACRSLQFLHYVLNSRIFLNHLTVAVSESWRSLSSLDLMLDFKTITISIPITSSVRHFYFF